LFVCLFLSLSSATCSLLYICATQNTIILTLAIPQDVWRFLLDTADALREPAEADFSLLRQFNRSRGGDDDGAFGPADLQYLMMCHQSSQSADQIPASVRLSGLLRLDHCLAGLNSLVGSLFGISLQQAPIDPTEAWADVQAAGLTKVQSAHSAHVFTLHNPIPVSSPVPISDI
jgi:Zn-dependent oligopeptidase